jgi:hypothetical protein
LIGVQAQTPSITQVWILQNPELAVDYTVITFYPSGKVLQETTNLLTQEKASVQSFWQLDTKKHILTITDDNGSCYQGQISLTDNTLTIIKNGVISLLLAKPGSANDQYFKKVKIALELYGADASLKKNGLPSSSRATGYSFQPRYVTCPYCFGVGSCINCHGSGMVTFNFRDYQICPSCQGTGKCWFCHGTGKKKNY